MFKVRVLTNSSQGINDIDGCPMFNLVLVGVVPAAFCLEGRVSCTWWYRNVSADDIRQLTARNGTIGCMEVVTEVVEEVKEF